jgi:hypothetical protein
MWGNEFLMAGESNESYLVELIRGVGVVPFQYRILMPIIINVLMKIFHGFTFASSPNQIMKVMEFVSTVFLVFAYRAYISLFIENRVVASAGALSLFYVLPFNYLNNYGDWYYPYDIPSVLFITLGLILLYKRSFTWYYPLFILATFNRETTIFLTFIFLFVFWGRLGKKELTLHIAAQAFAWIIIKTILHFIYENNPGGGLFENHFFLNLTDLGKHGFYPYVATAAGVVWLPCLFFFRFVKDEFVRRAMWVLLPFLATMMFMGNLHELRIYGEMIPIVLTPAVIIFYEMVKRSFAANEGG